MAIDMSRLTQGVVLPGEVSSQIWGDTVDNSAVMTASRQISLPGAGVEIPVIVGEPVAGWVNETDPKPVSEHTLASKKIQAYKLAVIELFSNEFIRDLPTLYAELRRRLPAALGREFDKTVYGVTPAPGDNFDTLAAAPELAIGENVYTDLVAVHGSISEAGGELSHWLAAPKLRSQLLAAVDGFGRPLFTADATTSNTVGQMLGSPIVKTSGLPADGPIGVAGDFAGSSVWGSVEGIKIKVSDEAPIEKGDGTVISMFSRNMVAVLAEIEVGFRVVDDQRFAKIAAAPAGA